VAIFGEGFKSKLTKDIPWLQKTRLICWYDLDAAGFEMLNMIREYYPHTESFLMDAKTFHFFERFAVPNSQKRRSLPYLTVDEKSLYEFITENEKRLEQEHISQEYVRNQLLGIL
jgi:hypothetical protein